MYAYADPVPVLGSLGSASPTTRYYDEFDPVSAFFRGWQAFLGVPQTGAWDRATHDAVSAFLVGKKLAALPAWGTSRDPTAFGYAWGIFDDVFMGPSSGPIAAEASAFLRAFGLPSGDYSELKAIAAIDESKMVRVQAAARDAILAAESASATIGGCPIGEYTDAAGNCVGVPSTVDVRPVAPKAWYRKPSTWLAAAGVALLLGTVAIVARRN